MLANKFFDIKELVSKNIYEEHGDDAIKFLDEKALEALENVREILDVGLICNNWAAGGNRTQCGYREPGTSVGVAKSQHKLGRAFDLISKKMTAKQMREKLEANEEKLIHPIRIEKWDDKGEINWLHMDVSFKKGNTKLGKIYFFKA